jgi:dTDP-glucose 4,6-dehydratase
LFRVRSPLTVHGKGTRRQNYIDVRDAARAARLCIERRATGLYNIGAPEPISNLDLARRCVEVLGSSSTVTHSDKPDPDDALVWSMDTSRARQELGFALDYTLSDSIRALAAELQAI